MLENVEKTVKLRILCLLMKELKTTYILGKRIKLGFDKASISSCQYAGNVEDHMELCHEYTMSKIYPPGSSNKPNNIGSLIDTLYEKERTVLRGLQTERHKVTINRKD